jgi:hypothetical protein
VALWRESLSQLNIKAGQSLADPKDYENLFPGYAEALKTEQFLKPERQQLLPASAYPNITVSVKFPNFYAMVCIERQHVSWGVTELAGHVFQELFCHDISHLMINHLPQQII